MRKTRGIYPYLMTVPALLFIGVVSLYPTLYSLYLSLTRTRRGETLFVGLRNFQIIAKSSDFWESLRHTFVFSFAFVVFTVALAFLLALLMNRKLRLTGVYMTAIFLPWILSEITSGVVWRWMFYQDYGILQRLLGPLFDGTTLIARPGSAMAIVVAATVWRSLAFAMLLLLAGLQTIPRETHEAASIDGATGWQDFWRVTWPLVLPTTMVTIVFLTIQAVNGVGMILAITEGGPGRGTEVLSLHMYREGIEYYNFGYAAALSVVLLVINVVLAAFYIRSLRRESALAA